MLREFLAKPAGKVVAALFLVIAIVASFMSIRSAVSGGDAERAASGRMFVDAKTGQAFDHTIAMGEKIPIVAPSGGASGYPGEACYWTKDGKIKDEPTWVLLNRYVNKSGPTFCPDCGRLVIAKNPQPHPGDKAPPTKSELGDQPVPLD